MRNYRLPVSVIVYLLGLSNSLLRFLYISLPRNFFYVYLLCKYVIIAFIQIGSYIFRTLLIYYSLMNLEFSIVNLLTNGWTNRKFYKFFPPQKLNNIYVTRHFVCTLTIKYILLLHCLYLKP